MTTENADQNQFAVNFCKFQSGYYARIRAKQFVFVDNDRGAKFPENEFIWSDMDPRFKYTVEDMPKLSGRADGLKVKVARFRGVDDIWCELFTEEAEYFRSILDEELKKYCEGVPFDPTLEPTKGQICFIKVPSYKEIDEFMEGSFGVGVWHKARKLSRRTEYENSNASKWMRAECRSFTTGRTGILVQLVDTGRQLPVPIQNIRRAVLRHISWPVLGINVMIALMKPTQYTYELTTKWFQMLPVGTELELMLCGKCVTKHITRLVSPTEDQLDDEYRNKKSPKDVNGPVPLPLPAGLTNEDLAKVGAYMS